MSTLHDDSILQFRGSHTPSVSKFLLIFPAFYINFGWRFSFAVSRQSYLISLEFFLKIFNQRSFMRRSWTTIWFGSFAIVYLVSMEFSFAISIRSILYDDWILQFRDTHTSSARYAKGETKRWERPCDGWHRAWRTGRFWESGRLWVTKKGHPSLTGAGLSVSTRRVGIRRKRRTPGKLPPGMT